MSSVEEKEYPHSYLVNVDTSENLGFTGWHFSLLLIRMENSLALMKSLLIDNTKYLIISWIKYNSMGLQYEAPPKFRPIYGFLWTLLHMLHLQLLP